MKFSNFTKFVSSFLKTQNTLFSCKLKSFFRTFSYIRMLFFLSDFLQEHEICISKISSAISISSSLLFLYLCYFTFNSVCFFPLYPLYLCTLSHFYYILNCFIIWLCFQCVILISYISFLRTNSWPL